MCDVYLHEHCRSTVRSSCHHLSFVLLCVSVALVIQLHMLQDMGTEQSKFDAFTAFNDDEVTTPHPGDASAATPSAARPKRARVAPPPLDYMYKFIKTVHECAAFSPECLILSLVFINRLIAYTGLPLHTGNFRGVLLTALLIAQKVWDDRSLLNSQFTQVCPVYTAARISTFERVFLQWIDYDLAVSSRLYAKYYFELRALLEQQNIKSFSLSPLTPVHARQLEVHLSCCQW